MLFHLPLLILKHLLIIQPIVQIKGHILLRKERTASALFFALPVLVQHIDGALLRALGTGSVKESSAIPFRPYLSNNRMQFSAGFVAPAAPTVKGRPLGLAYAPLTAVTAGADL